MDDFTADAVISQLLLLDAQDPKKVRACSIYPLFILRGRAGPDLGHALCTQLKKRTLLISTQPFGQLSFVAYTQDIKLFINSPGGSVTAGMGIYDAMQMCRADVSTVCMGLAASMGAFLLTSGARGQASVHAKCAHHDSSASRWSVWAGR